MAARGGGCSHPGCGQRIGVSEAAGAGLKRCQKCRQIVYCSKECQVAGWIGGHKQECKALREGGSGATGAAARQALVQAVGGTELTRAMEGAELTNRQTRVLGDVAILYYTKSFQEAIDITEEGKAVAEEMLGTNTRLSADIYRMLGESWDECGEYVGAQGLLEKAREAATAFSLESGDTSILGQVCSVIGNHYQRQGEHEKGIEEHEQARAITVELGRRGQKPWKECRQNEGATLGNMGLCYAALKQYDKAIELQEKCLAIYEEFDDKKTLADTCVNLGLCLSKAGQHDRAVACLKRAWSVFKGLGTSGGNSQTRVAVVIGKVRLAQALGEHRHAAADAANCSGVSAAQTCADTLQEAEAWLRKGRALAVKHECALFLMHAQRHLASVTMLQGNEDEAVAMLWQHLQGWTITLGHAQCHCCAQMRGKDAPMLTCGGCRVARSVYPATLLPLGTVCHACCVERLTARRGWAKQVLQRGAATLN